MASLLSALFNSTGLAVLLPGLIYCGLSAANYFKFVARNEPLLPWDFILIGEDGWDQMDNMINKLIDYIGLTDAEIDKYFSRWR